MSFIVLLASSMFWFYNCVRAISIGYIHFSIFKSIIKNLSTVSDKNPNQLGCAHPSQPLSRLRSAFWPKTLQQSPHLYLTTQCRHHPPFCPWFTSLLLLHPFFWWELVHSRSHNDCEMTSSSLHCHASSLQTHISHWPADASASHLMSQMLISSLPCLGLSLSSFFFSK